MSHIFICSGAIKEQQLPITSYRFLQVVKQSLAFRVVDEQQIERHFTAKDITVLYSFKPKKLDRKSKEEDTPDQAPPKDRLLAELLRVIYFAVHFVVINLINSRCGVVVIVTTLKRKVYCSKLHRSTIGICQEEHPEFTVAQ